MNCKWAEGHLSACLDGTLDPAVRVEVEAHVASCTHCSGIVDEYRYFDGLVRDLPRFEPSGSLQERIFGSPEFAAILHGLDGHASTARGTVISGPVRLPQIGRDDDAPRGGHDRPLEALPIPTNVASDGAAALPPALAGVASSGDAEPGHGPSGGPPWARIALSAAAAVVIAVGSALLIRQGLLPAHSSGGRVAGISNVGQVPAQQPLSAGTRVVYLRSGALWSAPEHDDGLAKQLTPAGVVVAPGWAVVPTQGAAGGESIAYIDQKTGLLHLIRSDDQQDHTVGRRPVSAGAPSTAFWTGAEGQAILGGIAWSPDGAHLAYLADDGTGHTALFVVNAAGTSTTGVTLQSGSSASLAKWSPDGRRLAFVQTSAAGQSLWDYNVAADQMRQLSATAEPGGNTGATVRVLEWLGSAAGPGITWASGDPTAGTYTGLFSLPLAATVPQRLVPAGAVFTAAAYTPARANGTWLLGDSHALYAASALYPGRAQLLEVPVGVAAVSWSPDGMAAAILGGDGSLRVWIKAQFPAVASAVAALPSFVWAPDGSALAFVANGHVTLVGVSTTNNQVGAPAVVPGLIGATALAWAPDGQFLAIAAGGQLVLVSPNGIATAVLDQQAAAGPVVWTNVR
jgi:hypothetical protein